MELVLAPLPHLHPGFHRGIPLSLPWPLMWPSLPKGDKGLVQPFPLPLLGQSLQKLLPVGEHRTKEPGAGKECGEFPTAFLWEEEQGWQVGSVAAAASAG